MSKSAIYMVNTNTQTITNPSTVSFGSVVRKFGCNIENGGTAPVIRGIGYYDIDTNINFTAGAAGVATFTLFKDGVAIQGATQAITVAAATQYSVNVPAIVREMCCDSSSNITMTVSGVAGTITNATILVEKL